MIPNIPGTNFSPLFQKYTMLPVMASSFLCFKYDNVNKRKIKCQKNQKNVFEALKYRFLSAHCIVPVQHRTVPGITKFALFLKLYLTYLVCNII
jgi:hypothetical protein